MFTIQNVSNCDVSTILAAPPSAGAEVSINNIQLIPSPFVNITVEKNVVNDTIIGGVWKVQLNGTVTGSSFNEVTAGCNSQNQPTNTGKTYLKKILELSKCSACAHVIIRCGCDFIDGYGRIISASINEGDDPTWVTRGSYSIEIELYNNKDANGKYVTVVSSQNAKCPESSSDPNPSPSPSPNPCTDEIALKDLNESFSISIDEDTFNWGLVKNSGNYNDKLGVGRRHIKVGFSISAKGLGGGFGSNGGDCLPNDGSGNNNPTPTTYFGLAAAEKYIKCRIDKLRHMDLSGISSLPNMEIVPAFKQYTSNNSKSYLDFRTLEVNPIDQSINLTGDIIYRPANSGCHPEVFTSINVEESVDNEGSQITISGNIEGLAEVTYNADVNTDKDMLENLIACSGTGLINASPLCDYNKKMEAADSYFKKIIDDENLLKDIADAHCNKQSIVIKCINNNGQVEDILPCLSVSPEPTPSSSSTCGNLQLISRQVSRDYATGSISFTFIFTNKEQDCSSIDGVSNLDIEATHDMPRDNIVETIVPGRGKKGVLIQNLCCLSADRWSFDVNMVLANKSKKKSVDSLRHCANKAIEKFINDRGIKPDPLQNCWFVTDLNENLGKKTYKYSIQFTKPSC